MRSIIKSALLRKSIVVSRPPGQFAIGAFKLARVRDRGLRVSSAIDGGAAEGGWTEEFKRIYPDARVLCVEPREEVRPHLNRMASRLGGVTVTANLLGPEDRLVQFNESGDQSSILPNSSGGGFGHQKAVAMVTLDSLIEGHAFPWPDLIKLDLQGYELEALKGAARALERAQAVVLEVSFIEFQKGMPLIADALGFMKQRGFRCYDVFSLWHRPLDGAMAQGDLLFVSESSALVADSRWSASSEWA